MINVIASEGFLFFKSGATVSDVDIDIKFYIHVYIQCTSDKSTLKGRTKLRLLGHNIKIYKFKNLNNDFLGLLIAIQ